MQAKVLAAHASLVLPAAGSAESTKHDRLHPWKPSKPVYYKRRAIRQHCIALERHGSTCAKQDSSSCKWAHQVPTLSPPCVCCPPHCHTACHNRQARGLLLLCSTRCQVCFRSWLSLLHTCTAALRRANVLRYRSTLISFHRYMPEGGKMC